MMFEELSKLYAETAQMTIAVLPEKWKAFWIRQECSEGTWGFRSYYEVEGVDEIRQFDAPDDATRLIYGAWKISRANNDRWSSIVFHVLAPGELHITFGHDNYDDEECSGTYDRTNEFRDKAFAGRTVVPMPFDIEGSFSLTPEMLKSGCPRTSLLTATVRAARKPFRRNLSYSRASQGRLEDTATNGTRHLLIRFIGSDAARRALPASRNCV